MKAIAVPLTCPGDGTGDLQPAECSCSPCPVYHCAYYMITLKALTLSPKLPVCVSPTGPCTALLRSRNLTELVNCHFYVYTEKMKGRKKRHFLPSPFTLLFFCIAGHAAAELDGSEEEHVVGKRYQKTPKTQQTKTKHSNNKAHSVKMHCRCNPVLQNFCGKLFKLGLS